MRLGVALRGDLAADALLVQELGYTVAWIDAHAAPAPLVAAAAVAQRAPAITLAPVVVAGVHPVTLAEEAAVADLCCAGRLVLVLTADDAPLLDETVAVLWQAWAGRPFSHDGAHWRIPARRPEHAEAEALVRVTPPPAQLEPPIWLAGPAAAAVAAARGLARVADGTDAPAPAAARVRRPALVRVEAGADPRALAARLVAARAGWGLDVAILDLPAGLGAEDRAHLLARVAEHVLPRVQLTALPAGLEDYWRSLRG